MEALIAIALLCQVSGGKMDAHHAERHQIRCQKRYIMCLEKGIKPVKKNWIGALKKCVLERVEESK